jgi:hypothetical protein
MNQKVSILKHRTTTVSETMPRMKTSWKQFGFGFGFCADPWPRQLKLPDHTMVCLPRVEKQYDELALERIQVSLARAKVFSDGF